MAETWSYNSRLQPRQVSAVRSGTTHLSLGFFYCGSQVHTCSDNNGNMRIQTLGIPGQSWTQSFGYDGVNRLSSVSETGGAGWSQSFGYDNWGNRWVSAYTNLVPQPQTPATSSWYNTANNRLKSAGYDLSGNQTTLGALTMMYDAEGRTTQAQKSVVGQSWTTQYKYDGDGRRVKKLDAAGATTVFVYDATGNLAAEYYSGSVTATKGVDYLTADHLGSTRMISNESGTIVTRRDYQPFGEEIPSSIGGRPGAYDTQTEIKQQFTGKERDAETGLDYFDFRYAASVLARFTSPDPEGFGSHIEDPQSWNRYVYARNNPLKYIDPLGLDYYEICGIDGKDCGRYSEKLYDKIRKDRNYIVAGAKLYARKKDGTQGELLGTVARIETGMGGLGDELTAGMAARAGASNQFIGTFAAASVAVGATGGAAANLLGLTSGSGLTTIGTIEVGTGTAQSGSAFTILNNQVPQKTIAELTRAAQKLYPNKANLLEQHHIFPKYLGGPANGPTAPLNVSV